MKMPKIYYGALAVFCILTLFIGLASAADMIQSAPHGAHVRGSGHSCADPMNVTMQQQVIARFEKQGVDVTELNAAFEKGDTAAVKTWFETYRKAHPNEMPARSMRGHPSPQNT